MKRPRAGSVANAERAQQRQREGQQRQQHRPRLERAALLGDGQRVDQRGAGEPGHERCVLHRIPEPPAAPAQHVVRPGAAQHDADGQARPRGGRPRPRPARPGGVELALDQRGDGECERHREADIAHVEHRRVRHHARVLQQRVQVVAVHGHGHQALERVRRRQHEQQEADGHQAHDAQHTRDERRRQAGAPLRDRQHPAREHREPQQQRALVAAPDPGDAVGQRQRAVGVAGHVEHREVVAHEAGDQAAERHRHEQRVRARRGTRQRHPVGTAARRADHRQRAQDQRHGQRDQQRDLAKFRNHRFFSIFIVPPCAAACLSAAAASGGM
jgi:hypothetical protein